MKRNNHEAEFLEFTNKSLRLLETLEIGMSLDLEDGVDEDYKQILRWKLEVLRKSKEIALRRRAERSNSNEGATN